MQAPTLIRLSAAAAIVAGTLRIGSAFLGARLGTTAAELLYLVIDTGFVLAILGAYLSRHVQLGIAGFVGFLLALCAAASIVGPDGERPERGHQGRRPEHGDDASHGAPSCDRCGRGKPRSSRRYVPADIGR